MWVHADKIGTRRDVTRGCQEGLFAFSAAVASLREEPSEKAVVLRLFFFLLEFKVPFLRLFFPHLLFIETEPISPNVRWGVPAVLSVETSAV